MSRHGHVATITLNRPDSLNTIVPPMPDELQDAILRAGDDGSVRVIVLRGAGRAFCAGFDFGGGFHHWDERITTEGSWDPGKDFAMATAPIRATNSNRPTTWTVTRWSVKSVPPRPARCSMLRSGWTAG